MEDRKKTKAELLKELASLREQVAELQAIEGVRKEEERARRTAEQEWILAFNSISEHIVYQDIENRVLWANKAAGESVGAPSEQLLGRYCYEIWHQRKEPCEVCPVIEARRTGQPQEAEVRSPDGREWFIRGYPVKEPSGEVVGLVEVTWNITERKRAEEALRFAQFAMERAVDAVFLMGKDARFFYVNEAACRNLGYSREELLSMSVHDVDPWFPAERWAEHWREVKEKGSFSFESRHRTKDGKVLPVEVTVNYLEFEGKEYNCAFARHITERKRVEEALRESKELYHSLFENVPVGLYRTTSDGKILDVNLATVQMLGYPDRESLLAVNVADCFADPEQRTRWKTLMERQGVVRNFEAQLRRHDGAVIWIEDSTRAVKDEEEQILYYEGTLKDITERKQAEEERKQGFLRLRRSLGQTVNVLASAVELRDRYTAGHQRRVTHLARAIATEMGLSEDQIDAIRMAGAIHDIGKINVPAEILSKPSRLSEMEMNLIRIHPQSGFDILKDVDFPWPVAPIVLQHHERLDGSGYPDSLSADEILLEARILAVADVVEAMCSHRPYRTALGIDKALEEIVEKKGILFDPDAVDACVRLFTKKGFKLE
jgi:PAS domain S-box-containing protein